MTPLFEPISHALSRRFLGWEFTLAAHREGGRANRVPSLCDCSRRHTAREVRARSDMPHNSAPPAIHFRSVHANGPRLRRRFWFWLPAWARTFLTHETLP